MAFPTDDDADHVNRLMDEQRQADALLRPVPPGKARCQYFRDEVRRIVTLDEPKPSEMLGVQSRINAYRKQLLVSVIDTVAAHRFMPECEFGLGSSGNRFVHFVTQECGWKDAQRVSLQVLMMRFLHRSFEKSNPTASDGLPKKRAGELKQVDHPTSWSAKRIRDGLAKYRQDPGRDISVHKVDPFLDELMPLAETKFEWDLLCSTTLARLLYQLRNFRVHEMRTPGGIDVHPTGATDVPYYHHFNDDPDLHLVFHVDFIHKLALNGIDALEAYLLTNDIDPYQSLRDTSAWEVKEFTPLQV